MEEAVAESRKEAAALLTAAETDRAVLAGACGGLGALTLLLAMEAQADACFRNARKLQPRELRWLCCAGYLAMMSGNTDRALERIADTPGLVSAANYYLGRIANLERRRGGNRDRRSTNGSERGKSGRPDGELCSDPTARGADDLSLRKPEKALQIASRLALLQPIPPHQRLLALAQAALGHFDEAPEAQKQAIALSV